MMLVGIDLCECEFKLCGDMKRVLTGTKVNGSLKEIEVSEKILIIATTGKLYYTMIWHKRKEGQVKRN